MSGFFYYLGVAADSVLSVFGVRAPYEQPPYHVLQTIDNGVEIRAYDARVAVETTITAANDGAAFGRLFRYITGANNGAAKISMTVPVQMGPPERIAMTVPVEMGDDRVMRFFLPKAVAAHPPAPTDPLVHVVTLPPETFGVLKFSGTINAESVADHKAALLRVLNAAGRRVDGAPSVFSYDPPFSIPFLRRNEVAARLVETP